MKIQEVTSKNIWEDFLTTHQPHSFLTSWNWGEVQSRLGTQIIRLGVFKEDRLVAVVLVLFVQARRGAFLFCPHGPVVAEGEDRYAVLETLTHFLAKRGKDLRCSFIRISPLFLNNEENRTMFIRLGFRNAPVHLMHPELAWLLDVQKDDEVLMKEMRKTTRYLIRKAEKEGVVIKEGTDTEALETFLRVYRTTVHRQQFTPFKDESFRSELEVFRADNQVKLFRAEYEGKVIASAIIIFYGSSGFYHHGASDQAYSQIPGSYLLQWRVIQEARQRGCHFYNFWGVVRPEQKKHPWAGLSLFKMGFGGFEEEYVHAQDYILSSRYWLVYLIERIRRVRRGL